MSTITLDTSARSTTSYGFEKDDIARRAPERVPRFRRNLTWLEWVVVGPLDGPRRTIPRFAEEHVIDEEPYAAWPHLRLLGDLRDDPDDSRGAGPAERRRDPD